MADIDPIEYLASKGLHGHRTTGGVEWTYPCFLTCDEPAGSRKRKLYVNADTGAYQCKVCDEHGGTTLLMRHFGDEPAARAPGDAPVPRRSAVLEAATRAGERMLADDDEAAAYLLGPDRNLSADLVVTRRLGWVSNRSLIDRLPLGEFTAADIGSAGITWQSGTYAGRDFFRGCVLIPYIENGRVVQIRGKSLRDGRYYTGQGETARLYNADALKGADEAIVVEGEFDAMVLADLLSRSPDPKIRSVAVVGLPGVHSLPELFDSYFENVRRVYIGTDPDEAGRRGAERLKERLGARATVLDWPVDLLRRAAQDGLAPKDVDWTTWIGRYGATWQDVLAMMRASSRLVSMSVAGARFRSRPAEGLKLGYPQLDALIQPGLQPGQLAIPLAKTGAGKTLWCCNVTHNLRDRRVLYITLEMTTEEIYYRLARIYRFYKPYATDEEIDFANADLRICDQNRLASTDFSQLINEYGDDVGAAPDVVIVDYLGYYAKGLRGSSRYEKTSDAVMQLKEEGKAHRVVLIAPHQVNRQGQDGKPLDADDSRDSGVVEETGDFVFGLYKPDDALDLNSGGMPTGKLKLDILKSRHGNKGRSTTLQTAPLSLAIIDTASPFLRAAREECHAAWRGTTYEEYQRTRTPAIQGELIGGAA